MHSHETMLPKNGPSWSCRRLARVDSQAATEVFVFSGACEKILFLKTLAKLDIFPGGLFVGTYSSSLLPPVAGGPGPRQVSSLAPRSMHVYYGS